MAVTKPTAPKRPGQELRARRTGPKGLEALFLERGFKDFRWLDPREFVVAEWVRMKCLFGCPDYGKNACCPPNTPPVDACARFFREYRRAVVFHFAKTVKKPEDRHAWSRGINLKLHGIEEEIFKAGFVKAFLMPMDSCNYCPDCPGARTACRKLKLARPSPDAMAIDVFATVRKVGYPIDVLSDYGQEMNRYAFLLID
jgi:predicted metal-binding protein